MKRSDIPSQDQAIAMLRCLPNRPDYDTWIRAISAIGNTYDNKTALKILHSHFVDEKPGEIEYKLQNRLSDVHFGSLVNLAEQNGYINDWNTREYSSLYFRNSNFSKSVTFENQPGELIYSFDDYELEERSAFYQYEANMKRFEADQKVISENPGAYERLFRVATNYTVINKNADPETNRKHGDYSAFTNNFQNVTVSLHGLVNIIGSGFPVCFGLFRPDDNGNLRRNNKSWICSEMFALDIDDGLSISNCMEIEETQKAILLYTTSSHSEDHNRYRIIFPLPRLIYDPGIYRKLISKFIEIYGADKQCSDLSRGYYGNNNAEMILIQTGEMLKYKNGKQI